MKKSFTKKLKKNLQQKVNQENGALSVLFLIIFPTTMLILFSIFAEAQTNRDQLDFLRACQNELDLTLADYDRQLWQEFGLWGTDIQKLNQNTDFLMKAYEKSYYDDSYSIACHIFETAVLSENTHLKNQILRHMNYRAPALFLDELMKRYTDYEKIGSRLTINAESLMAHPFINPNKIVQNPENFQGDVSELDVEIPAPSTDDSQEPMSAEKQVLKEKGMDLLAEKIEKAEELMIPIYKYAGVDLSQNPLEPDAVQALAGRLDLLFKTNDSTLIDRLFLSEYLLKYYTMHCYELDLNGRRIILQTPDGRKHQTLVEAGRKHEIEQILFEKEQAQEAFDISKNSIGGLCFTYHLINGLSNPNKQNTYLAEATALSGSIALISFGNVIIEPQSLAYLCLLIDVATSTKCDVENVISGQTIRFTVSETEIQLSYKDFMQIFLLLKSEDELLKGMTRIREKVIPKQFAVAFRLKADFGDKSIMMKRSFSDFCEMSQ